MNPHGGEPHRILSPSNHILGGIERRGELGFPGDFTAGVCASLLLGFGGLGTITGTVPPQVGTVGMPFMRGRRTDLPTVAQKKLVNDDRCPSAGDRAITTTGTPQRNI